MISKKVLILIIIIAMIICSYFIIGNNAENNKNNSFSFDIPTNYKIIEQTKNFAKLGNEKNEIYIYKLNSNETIETYKEKYPEYIVSQELFTINNVNKTVATNNKETILKYWFMKNNQKFQIQMIKNNENSDQIAENIINSFKTF